MIDIIEVIKNAQALGASDVHVVCGLPVRIRIDGELRDHSDHIMTDQECLSVGEALLGEGALGEGRCGEIDSAITVDGSIRCRLNLFWQQGHLSSAIRILRDSIPVMEELGLPPVVNDFLSYPRGIVLVTGETGSGKSTTLAALLDGINHTRREHIITLEDPVEYIYQPDLCVINQREVGKDTASYESGLKSILREDPDIILIGEMRSLETIETALTAAETGHLVFATLHTNSAADSIDRIVDVFPGERQQQIRLQLSNTLKAVLSQQLLPKEGGGRTLACEVMITTTAIRNLIREGKTPQIVNSMSTDSAHGNLTMDNCMIALANKGKISGQTAIEAAMDEDYVRKCLRIPKKSSKSEFVIKRDQ